MMPELREYGLSQPEMLSQKGPKLFSSSCEIEHATSSQVLTGGRDWNRKMKAPVYPP